MQYLPDPEIFTSGLRLTHGHLPPWNRLGGSFGMAQNSWVLLSLLSALQSDSSVSWEMRDTEDQEELMAASPERPWWECLLQSAK